MLGRPGSGLPVLTRDLGRCVVKLVGVHRLDDRQIVDHFRQVRDDLG